MQVSHVGDGNHYYSHHGCSQDLHSPDTGVRISSWGLSSSTPWWVSGVITIRLHARPRQAFVYPLLERLVCSWLHHFKEKYDVMIIFLEQLMS